MMVAVFACAQAENGAAARGAGRQAGAAGEWQIALCFILKTRDLSTCTGLRMEMQREELAGKRHAISLMCLRQRIMTIGNCPRRAKSGATAGGAGGQARAAAAGATGVARGEADGPRVQGRRPGGQGR
jgi:hypothetical protein